MQVATGRSMKELRNEFRVVSVKLKGRFRLEDLYINVKVKMSRRAMQVLRKV
jgi:hypothetical protein